MVSLYVILFGLATALLGQSPGGSEIVGGGD